MIFIDSKFKYFMHFEIIIFDRYSALEMKGH